MGGAMQRKTSASRHMTRRRKRRRSRHHLSLRWTCLHCLDRRIRHGHRVARHPQNSNWTKPTAAMLCVECHHPIRKLVFSEPKNKVKLSFPRKSSCRTSPNFNSYVIIPNMRGYRTEYPKPHDNKPGTPSRCQSCRAVATDHETHAYWTEHAPGRQAKVTMHMRHESGARYVRPTG